MNETERITKCPICKTEAKLQYACGDYFIYCSDGCISPMCDHAGAAQTMEEWERWVAWFRRWKNRKIMQPAEPLQPLTLEELREMKGEPVWLDYATAFGSRYEKWAVQAKNEGREDVISFTDDTALISSKYGCKWFAYRQKPTEG